MRVKQSELEAMVSELNRKAGRPQRGERSLRLNYQATYGGKQYGGYRLVEMMQHGGEWDIWPRGGRAMGREMAAYLEGALGVFDMIAKAKEAQR